MPSAKKQLTKKSTPVWPIKLILNKATSTTTLDYAKNVAIAYSPHTVWSTTAVHLRVRQCLRLHSD